MRLTDVLDPSSGILEYVLVDVFALPGGAGGARPFTGNPLAVVFGAEALTTEQCQALAAEFNLSETVFPSTAGLDPQEQADYRVRIFMPGSELPFAGHPSIGAAWTLAAYGDVLPGRRRQLCGAGVVDVEIPAADDPAESGGAVRLTGPPPSAMLPASAPDLLPAVGLERADASTEWGPAIGGSGIAFAFLPVAPGALARCRPDAAAIAAISPAVTGVLVFELAVPSSGHLPDGAPLQVKARMFAADLEDPATGSAALGLGGWLVHSGVCAADGVHAYDISQGVELGRPSFLQADVSVTAGAASRVRVSGRVVAVGSGRIRVP